MPLRRESGWVGWTTTNPAAAQRSTRGSYPSRDQALPWENTMTGRSRPDSGAVTFTCSSTPRPGAGTAMGLTAAIRWSRGRTDMGDLRFLQEKALP